MEHEKTELIRKYYKETDPMRRKKILEKSIEQGEDPEGNPYRLQLWECRYQKPSQASKGGRADGYIRVWMNMKFSDGNTGLFSGSKKMAREIRKDLESMKFFQWSAMEGTAAECFRDECIHAAALYLESCETDHSYGSGILGIMPLSEERKTEKIMNDFYGIAFRIPENLKMIEELRPFTEAAMKVYQDRFPYDEFEEPCGARKRLLGNP